MFKSIIKDKGFTWVPVVDVPSNAQAACAGREDPSRSPIVIRQWVGNDQPQVGTEYIVTYADMRLDVGFRGQGRKPCRSNAWDGVDQLRGLWTTLAVVV